MPMGDPYISMWTQDQVDFQAEILTVGDRLDHTAGKQFRQRGVAVGDRVYVVARERQVGRLVLIGRLVVERITDQRGADAYFGRPVYRAPDHLLGKGSELRLDRVVPQRTARELRRESGKPLKIADGEYSLDQQTLRATGRVTEESAALLDAVLLRSSAVAIDPRAYREGARKMRLHIAAERSAGVRSAALAIHGSECQVCGFSFAKVYGDLGASFAEVHHLVPFKNLSSARFVDPAKDVAVLCANCHRMVHRREPLLTPSELRSILEAGRSGGRRAAR